MKTSNLLIRTKLYPPFVRPSLVPRTHLKERIMAGLQGPLTLVIAPAGFGKTTLVASSVIDLGIPAAWLSLDPSDNQISRFLTYIIAALQEVDPAIGNDAVQLMAGVQQAPVESILTSLINDLSNIKEDVILVVDDYQFVYSQAVHDALIFLLEHCPNRLHLVIAARSDPPLPLARLRARSQIVELRAADLRFSQPEATQFLNDIMGLRLDAISVETLEERTEGWIAGLQMAALSMRDREDVQGFIQGFSGTNRYILDYLLEEVLAREAEDVQSFLLQTAFLNQLNGSLCDAVTGASSGQKMLEMLERRNLFVIALDDTCCWYRYHHLFADLLQAKLYESGPDRVALLYERAIHWCEQNGQRTEAVEYALAAHEMDRAADLIERYAPERWAKSDPSVMQMADSLPLEIFTAQPKLGLYQAWFLICQGHLERAVPLLRGLAQQLTGAEADSQRRWMQTMVALALAFLSRSDPLPDYQLLNEIPVTEPILCDAADLLYGMTLGRRGDIDQAVEISARCLQGKKVDYDNPVVPQLGPFLAHLYLMQGRLHAADSLCREFLYSIQQKGFRFNDAAGGIQVARGQVLYEWNYLDEAEKYIRAGFQAGEPWHNIMADTFGLLALIRILLAKGEYADAMQAVERFEDRVRKHTGPFRFVEEFRTLRVRVQLASGDLESASDWVRQIQHTEDFHRHKERYQLTLARVRHAQRRYADVEELLTGFALPISGGNRIARQLESNLLLATALAGQRRLPQALPLIESSLALAEPEGYTRVFLDVGEPVRELLAAYLKSDAPAHKLFAQKLLDVFPSPSQARSASSQPVNLIEPLSGRELDVLSLMALGKTNQQIAQQLIVSPGTVKAHTASIYRKLNVTNRTEAAARARELGLLS